MARLAPVALLVAPLYVYRFHAEEVDSGREWVVHTVAARRMADRVILLAGCKPDPEGLRKALEDLARTTADNPAQVRVVESIRAALARSDMAEVARLAGLAAEEEDRLLDVRREKHRRDEQASNYYMDLMGVLGIAVSFAGAWIDYMLRQAAPDREEVQRNLDDARTARKLAQEQVVSLIRQLNDFRREVSEYEGLHERDRTNRHIVETIKRLESQLDAREGRDGPGE
jgi:hypothetical protein